MAGEGFAGNGLVAFAGCDRLRLFFLEGCGSFSMRWNNTDVFPPLKKGGEGGFVNVQAAAVGLKIPPVPLCERGEPEVGVSLNCALPCLPAAGMVSEFVVAGAASTPPAAG